MEREAPPSGLDEVSPTSSSGKPSKTSYIYHIHDIDPDFFKPNAWPISTMQQDSSPSGQGMDFVVYSLKSPEQVKLFGLRGHDIISMRPAPVEGAPVSPTSWGFANSNVYGVCKYCQLMLHPDAPRLIKHYPNLQRLINSGKTCHFCKWLEVSIQRGSSGIVQAWQDGTPSVCDENNTENPVTVELTNYPQYTRAIASVGPRQLYTNHGAPMTITTMGRLGNLASRRIWVPHERLDVTQSFKRMDILRSWLEDCADHDVCTACLPAKGSTKLPKRILDLTDSPNIPTNADDIVIRLRETVEGEVGVYTALSYCWGSNPEFHFTTTAENVQKHRQCIDYSLLPLTHKEAVLVTLYLGIRYLWIDSVCIVQGSQQDWESEAADMGSIYANAQLVLAATAAPTPAGGLLVPFQSGRTTEIHGETAIFRFETHLQIDGSKEPLNTRGWTFQEGILASRIVCFGQEQWLWKCPGRYATEDGLLDESPRKEQGATQWASLITQGPGPDGKNYLRNWYDMITNYSHRHLTYHGDKINAIAGLTKMFIDKTGYCYLAGLWTEDLANGLMWQAVSSGVRRDYDDIPSWSWLSIQGQIRGYMYRASTPLIELVNFEQQWFGVPLVSPLKTARLTLKGPLLQVSLGKRVETQPLRHAIIAAPESSEILGEAFLDTQPSSIQQTSEVFCLLVYEEFGSVEDLALVVVPAPNGGSERAATYKRIGVAIIWKMSKSYNGDQAGREVRLRAVSTTLVLV